MHRAWLAGTTPLTAIARRTTSISAFTSSQEGILRKAHKSAWPEVNLDTLQVNKVGRRVRQHVNPFKEELQVPLPPLDWDVIYQQPSLPLTIDIGCGPGRFLLACAKRLAPNNYLGLEIRQPLIHRANEWARAMDVSGHVHFVLANANVQLQTLLKSYPGPINLVAIQFPDPQFKAKHKKRRIVQPALVQTISDALQPGGRLFMQSDVLEVAESMWSEVEISAAGAFQVGAGNWSSSAPAARPRHASKTVDQSADVHTWLGSNPIGVPTEREVVCEELGYPLYRVLFIKT